MSRFTNKNIKPNKGKEETKTISRIKSAKEKQNQKNRNNSSQNNPLLVQQTKFLQSLPSKIRDNFFSDNDNGKHKEKEKDTKESIIITPEIRAEIWSNQATIGESLVNQYSWATPDDRALNILKHFSPIVEIGCGANAYWAHCMKNWGIDVLAFDISIHAGGKFDSSSLQSSHNDDYQNHVMQRKQSKKKRKMDGVNNTNTTTLEKKVFDNGLIIREGGPEILSSKIWKHEAAKRSLFLCYPDEDIQPQQEQYDDLDQNGTTTLSSCSNSMAAQCLEHYKGTYVIYVGELYGECISMDQAPWGRSASAEFQQRLNAEYHCLLKAKLTNWLHVRDTISVWKRTECCTIVFQGDEEDDDDESDEEVSFKHIPVDETIQIDVAAPCVQHLLRYKGS